MKCKKLRILLCVMVFMLFFTGCGAFTLYSDTYIDEYAKEKYGDVTLVKKTKIDSKEKNYVYQSPLGFEFTIKSILTSNAVFPGLRYRDLDSDYTERISDFYQEKMKEIVLKYLPSENYEGSAYGARIQVGQYAQCADAASAICELSSYLKNEGKSYDAKSDLTVYVLFGEGKFKIDYSLDGTAKQEVLQKELEMYELHLIQNEGLQDDTITEEQMTSHPLPTIEHFTFNSADAEDLKKLSQIAYYSVERDEYEIGPSFNANYDSENVENQSQEIKDIFNLLLLKYCPESEHNYDYKTKTLTYTIDGNNYEIYYPYNEYSQKLKGKPVFKRNGEKLDIKIYDGGTVAKFFHAADSYRISVTDVATLLGMECKIDRQTGTIDFSN